MREWIRTFIEIFIHSSSSTSFHLFSWQEIKNIFIFFIDMPSYV